MNIPILGKVLAVFLGNRKHDPKESAIERKIRLALKRRAKSQKSTAAPASPHTPSGSTGLPPTRKQFSLNTIALKFPKADAAFRQIRQKFDFYDKDNSQSIDMDELKECLKELQVSLSESEIQQLFQEADMDSSNGVQFKEFILLMAIVHLLHPSDTTGGARFGLPEVDAALNMVEDAFLFFDEDGDGYLSKDEIQHALTDGKEGGAGSAATQRFAEMDYNTDGLCSFKEFLYAYVGWVGTAEDEDEDEDEGGETKEQGATSENPGGESAQAKEVEASDVDKDTAKEGQPKKHVGFQ